MNYIRIESIENIYWEDAMKIYKGSFPIFEQRTMENQIDVLEDEQYNCIAVCEAEELVGILFYWAFDKYKYIEHLAISPKLRGRNYGSRILKEFCDDDKTIILEIDLPVDEVSINRLRFYKNIGFKMQDVKHVHPPYRKEYEGHKLKVLSFNKDITDVEYNEFNSFLKDRIMKYAEK